MRYPDFEELLAELNAGNARYLIGGAHAVAFHARPRATKDLEVFLQPTRSNALRAVAALTRFFGGKPPRFVSADALLDPNTIIQLGVAPVRVDLLTHLATVSFSGAWSRRVDARFGRVEAHYVGADDLIAEKEHFARPQDLADLVSLRRAQIARKRRTSRRVRPGQAKAPRKK